MNRNGWEGSETGGERLEVTYREGGAGLTPKDFPVEHSVIGRVGYPSPPGREFAYSPSYFFPSKRIAERKFLFLPLKFIYSSHE